MTLISLWDTKFQDAGAVATVFIDVKVTPKQKIYITFR